MGGSLGYNRHTTCVLSGQQMPPKRKRPSTKKAAARRPAKPRGHAAAAAAVFRLADKKWYTRVGRTTRPLTAAEAEFLSPDQLREARKRIDDEEARCRQLDDFLNNDGPAPPHVARHAAQAGVKILPEQAAAARAFCKAQWTDYHGQWPANAKSRTEIKKACQRILINKDQLHRQFQKYAKEVAGLRVGAAEGAEAELRYRNALLTLVGDGTDVVAAAIAAAATDRAFDVLPELRPLLKERVDGTVCLGLLKDWTAYSAKAWAAGANPMVFLEKRRKRAPAFREAFVTSESTRRNEERVGVLFEDCLYSAYVDCLRPDVPPPLALPQDFAPTTSTAQAETRAYVAGWLLHKVRQTFVHRDGALGEFAKAFTSAPISIGRAEAQRQGLAFGKIERTESEGGLIYPCRHMIQFVERLDATYNANLTLAHEEYYGSAVLMKVHELIAANDDAFLGFLESSVLPLINKSSFPRDVYAFMITKFAKCKRRDYGTVRNVEHDQARKHNAASGTVALRDTLKVARASKAASEA